MPEILSAASWRAKLRQPAVVSLASLDGAQVIVRPLSSLAKLRMEEAQSQTLVLADLIAESCRTGVVENDKVVEVGPPVWKAEEVISDEFPAALLHELSNVVLNFHGLGGSERPADFPSAPASGSPTASPSVSDESTPTP
jgi:hypothetical protein